ncbi:P-loop containing nucleoside triphosphate hydrolase protein [Lasiosphaeria hispida]|uniref:ATP-dependent RNA helicase n=1 Tax=Lasiosphaeria hispida TaxID=260671 RepID=A0AAJ0M941_9PEZI|nr:P-loop containing nucleoside triphosphate hydrolase protein [Lasiosphaeria hispida]
MYAGRYIPPAKPKPPPVEAPAPEASNAPPTRPPGYSSAAPYARYIPPTKAKVGASPLPVRSSPIVIKTAKHVQPDFESVVEPAIEPTQPVVQPKKIVFTDDDFPPQAPESKGIEKKKKSKRSKPEGVSEEQEPSPKRKKKSKTAVEEAPELKGKDPSSTQEEASVPQEKAFGGQEKALGGPKKAFKEQEETFKEPEKASKEEKKAKPKRDKKKKTGDVAPGAEAVEDDTAGARTRHKAVFEKVEKALQAQQKASKDLETEDTALEAVEEEPEEHGLEPLPQPEPVVFDESKLTYETLPPWLANPIRVTTESTRPFTELGITPEAAKVLELRGFKDAFAVQTAVLPLLMPKADRQGDVVVAAPTGSGKTLAYVLPMVNDISKGIVTKLRGIVVLPTRELVQQVQLACEACVAAFGGGKGKRVKIGTAVGNKVFKEEQALIMGKEHQYDPAGYREYMRKQHILFSLDSSGESDDGLPELNRKAVKPMVDHVFHHISKVDILICTPGRLVEHINKTRGFTLDYVRWLVVDEADKLLGQGFQQWLDVVMRGLSTQKPSTRDFPGSNKTGPRKVVLSATMTRDLSLLNGLQLSWPSLVLLEGTKAGEQALPALLKESVVKIREPSHKPLYLVDLLHSEYLAAINESTTAAKENTKDDEAKSASEASDSDSSSDDEAEAESPAAKTHKLNTTVLIFTKSNEAALRLSRLLAILSPDFAPLIGTLTSSTKTSRRAHTLRAFAQGKLQILVASDLVSRGIDLLNLDHVINYDLPISETSYVHRVGRTARAGRAGHAWTLVEYNEARRFWRDFAGEGKGATTNIIRSGKVDRVRIGGGEEGGKYGEDRVKVYEAALEQLRVEAGEGRK